MSCHGDWVNSGDLISHESPKTYVNFTAYSKGKQENKKTKKGIVWQTVKSITNKRDFMSERINVWFSGEDARRTWWLLTLNPLNPKSDQYLISPYSNTAEPFIKNMRVKEMITKLKNFDCSTNSPSQYQRKCIEKGKENVDTDHGV